MTRACPRSSATRGTIGADLDVRAAEAAAPRTIARLAERIHARLADGAESPTSTFREVVQFLDDVASLTDAHAWVAVRQEPLSTGERRWDALLAATAEWVAATHGFKPPRWTQSSRRQLPAPGWFVTPDKRLHDIVRRSTPALFARHGVYVDDASLRSI